ncbi:MAG: J domain-containing protein [Nostocaceae cyanobacterium]|nr:J domain-containing protein [Nostocaceae cyanobacterium]
MNNLEQCYEVLGILSNASIDEIKQAYRDLTQVWHPDRYVHSPRLQQKAEAQMKTINLAYEKILEHLAQEFTPSYSSSEFENEPNKADSSKEETSSQESAVEKFVKGLFKLTLFERKLLETRIQKFSDTASWRSEHLMAMGAMGGLTGAIGGPIGMAAILPELFICERYATNGSFGIGHLLKCQVDYDIDREIILAIWVGEGSLEKCVPVGKVGIKINDQAVSALTVNSVMGIVITKTLVKGSSKFLAKLSSKLVAKAGAKISAKLAAKTSTAWVPVFGGLVSGGINVWLVGSFLDAAEQYYTAQNINEAIYFVLNDSEFGSAL